MKKLAIIIAAVFVGFACGDDFTTISPKGVLADETLANAQGVDLLLTGAYSVLDGNNSKGGADWHVTGDNWWFDVLADDAHKGSTDGDQAELFNLETYNWQTGDPYIGNKWGALFSGVNRANAVISLIGTIEGEDLTQQLAEARFLRGHFNFELQKIWGNVPYISEENYAATEFNQPNDGPIWAEIEADFAYAKDNLPGEINSQPGRPNSFTAQAFLGKAMLFQGNYTGAASELGNVIANGPYALNAEFVDNYALGGENGPESVFAIQFVADAGQSFNGNRGGTLNFPGGGPINSCCGFYQPTVDLASAYLTDAAGLPDLSGTIIANDYGINSDEAFTPEAGNLDPRIDYTMGRRGIMYNNWEVNPGKDWVRATFGDISGPHISAKNHYRAGEDANRGTGGWGEQRSGINYNIMRYADVLLMAAEAAVETNDLATALDYVNQVRNRAKNSTPVLDADGNPAANYVVEPYAAFASQAEARDAVRLERRLELAMEGHRFFDLTRWGVAETVLNAYVDREASVIANFGDKAGTFMPHMEVLPIPVGAIDLSGGTLSQNSGF